MNAFLDESLGHGANLHNGAVQPDCGVYAVGEQVSRHSAASNLGIESPEPLATLWQVGIDGPILEEVGPVMVDFAESSLVDHFLG